MKKNIFSTIGKYQDLHVIYETIVEDSREKRKHRNIWVPIGCLLMISSLVAMITWGEIMSLGVIFVLWIVVLVAMMIIALAFDYIQHISEGNNYNKFELSEGLKNFKTNINRIAAGGGRIWNDPSDGKNLTNTISNALIFATKADDIRVSKIILETIFDKELNGGSSQKIIENSSIHIADTQRGRQSFLEL